MKRGQLYISTIDPKGHITAGGHGLGIEIAETCTAFNMDLHFEETNRTIREKLVHVPQAVLHGPFNELFPCAIDLKARELARERFREAIGHARRYGARKVILHGGYNPWIYYHPWYIEQSILFWKDFAKEIPEDMTVCIENVLEEEPRLLREVAEGVNDPRVRLCLDVGHVHAYSKISAVEWLRDWAPWIGHFHLHQNDGSRDSHDGLTEGTLPMAELLRLAEVLCPNATYTLEVTDAAPSVAWLKAEGIL